MKKFILCLSLCLFLSGCSVFPISLHKLPDPSITVENFFSCLDRQDCNSYLYNTSYTAWDTRTETNEIASLASSELKKSRQANNIETVKVKGKDAVVRVNFTSLDMRKINSSLKVQSIQLIKDNLYHGASYSSPDDIEPLTASVFSGMMKEPEQFYTTAEIFMSLTYDGGWKIIMDDALYDALLGWGQELV